MATLAEELDNIQELIIELEGELKDEIKRAAEDGEVTQEELDLIEYARRQVEDAKEIRKDLAAKIAKGGPEGAPGKLGEEPDGGDADSAKTAWKAFAKPYKKLLGLYADLKDEDESAASDLREYLDAIQVALSEENWAEALNQGVLAVMWADDEGLFEDYPPEEDDDDEDSGKEAWDKAVEADTMEDFRKLQSELEDLGNEHAGKLGDLLDKIDAAVKDENWSLALQRLVLCAKFTEDNKLWELVEEEEDDEDSDNLMPSSYLSNLKKIKSLHRDLDFIKHEKAAELGELIAAAPEKVTDPLGVIPADRALQRAYEFADKNKLWDAHKGLPKSEEEELFWKHNGKNYKKVKDLHRDLEMKGHELAGELGDKLAEIDKNIADQTYFAAIMGIDSAIEFADDEKLWDAPSGLPKAEEEKLFWEHHGKDYQKLKDLRRDLDFEGHEGAKDLAEILGEVDGNIKIQAFFAAIMGIDRGMELADDEKLWDERKGLPKSEEEALFWEHHGKNYDKVKDLLKKLQERGHEAVEELAEIVAEIDENVKNQTYFAATMGIDRAMEFADDNKLWKAADEPVNTSGVDPATAKISGSVGKGGKNKAADVETVQRLLNYNRANPELVPDGDCGKLTIGAIETFQKAKLGWKDGRVDPGGKTWAALTGTAVIDKLKDVAEDVADKVVDTAGKVADKAKDIVEDISDFFEDFLDGDDDKKKKG